MMNDIVEKLGFGRYYYKQITVCTRASLAYIYILHTIAAVKI